MRYSDRQRRQLWLYTFVCPAIDKFARIVCEFGSPEEIFDSPPEGLERALGAQTLNKMRRNNAESYIDALIDRLEERKIAFICRGDAEYPEEFEQLGDIMVPPELLFVRGARDIRPDKAVAMVGTRACTLDGAKIAGDFARDFARAGVTIVSGMAVGIDAASIEGALDAGGRTIGVLGCGIDVPYPAQNQALVRRMIENGGTLVSEYMPGMAANRLYFPIRNRIIAALAAGTLVIQAPKRSGALNTATYAVNYGRDLFVVPGSILDAKFTGSNELLRDGAAPALESRDVLETLGYADAAEIPASPGDAPEGAPDLTQSAGLTDDELILVRLLCECEHSFDEIISKAEFDAPKLNSLLTMLKIKGIIDETAGKHFRMRDKTEL